jgi:tRNA nucleotidyltransferase/poly(A) polymerase
MLTFTGWSKLREHRIVQNNKMAIPDDIYKIHAAFVKSGYICYIAGGAVRDLLLGRTPKDYDLATNAKPEESIEVLDKFSIKHTEEVGEQFGVVIATIGKEKYEIATFRADLEPGRDTKVAFISNPEEDAKRRDFTINALFYDITTNEVIDYVGGIQDIEQRRVRCVGDNPMQRFGEDPLRVLRLIRFHCRMHSSPEGIDGETLKAINHFVRNNLTDMLGRPMAKERVRGEFKKGLKEAQTPVTFLKLYYKLGILKKFVLPGFKNYNENFINTNDPYLAMASILKYNAVDEQFEQQLRQALHENAEVDRVLYYLNMLNLKRDKKFFKKFHSTKSDDAVALLIKLLKDKPNISEKELEQWASWFHMPMDIVRKFSNYQYRKKVGEIPGAEDITPGPILGHYIKGYNAWKSLRDMGKMPDFKEWLSRYKHEF